MKMPKGFNSKGYYNTGEQSAIIRCKECGKQFKGNPSKAKSLYLYHTKYNHPELLQQVSKEVKSLNKRGGYDEVSTAPKHRAILELTKKLI